MPPRTIPEAVRRELDEVQRLLKEQQNAAQPRGEQIRAQTTTLGWKGPRVPKSPPRKNVSGRVYR